MSVNNIVPFCPNPDDVHCFQCSLKMVTDYFKPELALSIEELEKITHYKPGLWTWSEAGLVWLTQNGFEVVVVQEFDSVRFAKEGASYIYDEFGKEVGGAQESHSDIKDAQEQSKKLLEVAVCEKREPTLDEIKVFLDTGYLILVNVNHAVLLGEEGYEGHAVVVTGYDDHHVVLHDPGPPPQASLLVKDSDFIRAWAYPNDKAKNLAAIRLAPKNIHTL